MKLKAILFLLPLATLVTGCPRNRYVLEIKPDPDGLVRTLTCWREDGQDTNGVPIIVEFTQEELSTINRLYPKLDSLTRSLKHKFTGKFLGETPDDVGGRGAYRVFPSRLGAAFVYVERFRGNDDVDATLEIKAVNQLVDILIRWSQVELGDHPNYARLQRFLDTKLRDDFRNASRYAWTARVLSPTQPGAEKEFGVRYGQYLAERGYLSMQDLPVLWTAAEAKDTKPILRWLQNLVARQLGVPLEAASSKDLAFLADEDSVKKSFGNFLSNTPEYAARLKRWEEERKTKPGAPKPEPLELPGELLTQALGLDAGNPADKLTVELTLPVPPTETNGRWDEKRNVITWDADLEPRGGPFHNLPALSFATWSVPDEKAQIDRFGKQLLEGENLIEYCFWCASLTPEELGAWDKVLAGCDPANFNEKTREFPDFPKQLIESTLRGSARAQSIDRSGP